MRVYEADDSFRVIPVEEVEDLPEHYLCVVEIDHVSFGPHRPWRHR